MTSQFSAKPRMYFAERYEFVKEVEVEEEDGGGALEYDYRKIHNKWRFCEDATTKNVWVCAKEYYMGISRDFHRLSILNRFCYSLKLNTGCGIRE